GEHAKAGGAFDSIRVPAIRRYVSKPRHGYSALFRLGSMKIPTPATISRIVEMVISMCSSAISMPSNDRRSSAINAARGTMMRRFMFSPPEEEVEQINQGSGEGGCHAPTDPHDALADRTQVPVHGLSPLL